MQSEKLGIRPEKRAHDPEKRQNRHAKLAKRPVKRHYGGENSPNASKSEFIGP
jgi:hypothetical protein